MRQMPQWRRERHERIKQINRETTLSAVEHSMDELRQAYAGLPEVLKYFDIVQAGCGGKCRRLPQTGGVIHRR